MKSGAIDFLQKPVNDQLLLERVAQALKKDQVNRTTLHEFQKVQARYETLTSREREVLHGVAHGKLNKVIASDLNVSTRTVEIHRAHVMDKMDAESLSSLMRFVSVLENNGILDRV